MRRIVRSDPMTFNLSDAAVRNSYLAWSLAAANAFGSISRAFHWSAIAI